MPCSNPASELPSAILSAIMCSAFGKRDSNCWRGKRTSSSDSGASSCTKGRAASYSTMSPAAARSVRPCCAMLAWPRWKKAATMSSSGAMRASWSVRMKVCGFDCMRHTVRLPSCWPERQPSKSRANSPRAGIRRRHTDSRQNSVLCRGASASVEW